MQHLLICVSVFNYYMFWQEYDILVYPYTVVLILSQLHEKAKNDFEGKYSTTLVTAVKLDGISSTLLDSVIKCKDKDMQDVNQSDKENVIESCKYKSSNIVEKDIEEVKNIPKLRPTECNETDYHV